MDNHTWAEQETQRLIAIGVHPMDAQRSTAWTLAHLPNGADPATWVPTADDLYEPLDKAAVQDAMTTTFERYPRKFKRLTFAVRKKKS